MATGLSIPIRVSTSGGFRLASGDEQDSAMIAMALLSDENENAFAQGIGLGNAMVFDISDPLSRATILASLRRVFERFERLKRFKLRENTIKWDEADGELILSFKYVSLEADEERDFRRKFMSGDYGAGGDASSNVAR